MAQRIGVIVNPDNRTASEFSDRLRALATQMGLEVFSQQESRHDGWEGEPVEVMVAIGGDGTMLAAVQAALVQQTPVLGFNLGTVGFLTEASPDDLEQVLTQLSSGQFDLEPRMTLEASLSTGAQRVGVNDVVIEKIESQRLVSLDLSVDGTDIVNYRADGLIVSTATGSTAYSFSAGGPLLDPTISALVVTAVAPHSLFDRTVIFRPDTILSARVRGDRPVRVTVDGRVLGSLTNGGQVTIRQSPTPVSFVALSEDYGFPERIADRLSLRTANVGLADRL